MNTASLRQNTTSVSSSSLFGNLDKTVLVGNRNLTINEVVSVARHGTLVRLSDDPDVLQRVQASCDYIHNTVESGAPIYGVTTGFGGMANVVISRECASLLREQCDFVRSDFNSQL